MVRKRAQIPNDREAPIRTERNMSTTTHVVAGDRTSLIKVLDLSRNGKLVRRIGRQRTLRQAITHLAWWDAAASDGRVLAGAMDGSVRMVDVLHDGVGFDKRGRPIKSEAGERVDEGADVGDDVDEDEKDEFLFDLESAAEACEEEADAKKWRSKTLIGLDVVRRGSGGGKPLVMIAHGGDLPSLSLSSWEWGDDELELALAPEPAPKNKNSNNNNNKKHNGNGKQKSNSKKSSMSDMRVQFALPNGAAAAHYGRRTDSVGVGGKELLLRLYDVETQQMTWKARNVPHDMLELRQPVWVRTICDVPTDENLWLTGTNHHEVRLWDTRLSGKKARPVWSVTVGDYPITCVRAFEGTSGNKFVYSDGVGRVEVADLRTGRALGQYRGSAGSVKSLAYSPADGLLASAGLDRHVRVYDARTRRCKHRLYLKQQLTCVSLFTKPDDDDDEGDGDESESDSDEDEEDDDAEEDESLWGALERREKKEAKIGKKRKQAVDSDSSDSDGDSDSDSDSDREEQAQKVSSKQKRQRRR
eukprot:TRINITY_DN66418_c9_g2_i1.p1 TRINITY_DN66418_c9_g2~~TRINITY_DN66418_c9_g2_i1.p1  ORF type:complete len:529 (+),score=287.60 TRINITY_DN66418_c9_g2_i1:6-1592(+)